jgi:DNA repair protein RadC
MTHSKTLWIEDAPGHYRPATADEVFEAHRRQLNQRFRRGRTITSPADTRDFLIGQLAHEPDEIFATLYLDNRHRLLEFVRHFTGTIDGCSVYPRAIVKRALELNAAAVILSHQHPSGVAEPSSADERITQRIRDALALVDVRVLDHIIVAGTDTTSLAERGVL